MSAKKSRPVRHHLDLRHTFDADGQPVVEPVEAESVRLGKHGGITTRKWKVDRFYHCGCDAQQPMGGQCGEPGCRRVSCQRCFGRCTACGKPLCLEHTRYFDGGDTQPVKMCRGCHGKTARRHTIRSVVKGLLSPFVSFDDRSTS